jgi:hypothetical protein
VGLCGTPGDLDTRHGSNLRCKRVRYPQGRHSDNSSSGAPQVQPDGENWPYDPDFDVASHSAFLNHASHPGTGKRRDFLVIGLPFDGRKLGERIGSLAEPGSLGPCARVRYGGPSTAQLRDTSTFRTNQCPGLLPTRPLSGIRHAIFSAHNNAHNDSCPGHLVATVTDPTG